MYEIIIKFKYLIKSKLNKIPLNIGKLFIIPICKFFLYLLYYNIIFKYIRFKIKICKEKYITLQNLKYFDYGNKKTFVIVYDNIDAPPAYGNLFYVAMLARLITIYKIKVIFYIVDSEFRYDWDLIKRESDNKNYFVLEQLKLVDAVVNSKYLELKKGDWTACKEIINDKENFILFESDVKRRLRIYDNFWSLLNNLVVLRKSHFILNKLLLNSNSFIKNIDYANIPKYSYITIGCRYDLSNESNRNMTNTNFIKVVRFLNYKYKDYTIMIVSCEKGCEYFSKIAIDNCLNVVNSKQFSSNFLGDSALVLNSKFYFQINGGGLAVISQCSFLPYEIYQYTGTGWILSHWLWSKNKIACWQTNNQLYFNTNKLPKKIKSY
jgi:hypothetical protein